MPGLTRPFALAFPLHGSRLIEASAGTGKTFTIAALYVRLVLGHGGEQGFREPLLPPQILVVTFTDAATQELRDRIRARLAEAAACFRGELAAPDPFLSQLREDYPPEQWDACGRRLEIAAEWMDEAAVSTIHGWCNRMLREHAFDSGSLFRQSLETDQGELLAEVARDYWRTFVYPLAGAELAAVRARWATPDALLGSVRGLLASAPAASEQPLTELLAAAGAERAAALQRLKAPWSAWLDELEPMFEAARKAKRFNGNKLRVGPWLSKLREWATTPELAAPGLTDTACWRLTPEGLTEAWNDDAPPAHPAFEAMRSLPAQLAALPQPLLAMQRHAAGWIARRFDREQRRRAQLGFDDLLARLVDALRGANGDRLAEVIRAQFPVALIDEFQDTDPVQYEIVDRVYRVAANRPEQGLFMIGDPKQAIYAFRGADIYTYLQAREATRGRHYNLDTNFRSTGELVAAVNHIFAQAEQRQAGQGAFLFRGAAENRVPFVPVGANGRRERFWVEGATPAALTCWQLQSEAAVGKTVYIAAMAEACAGEMVRLLNLGAGGRAGFRQGDALQPLRPADLAVLVRDRSEADAIRAALAARGVRSVYLSDKESVFASREAADLLLWLKACAEPDADRHLRAALASATLELDWPALDRLNQDELHWEQRVLQFRRYRGLWRAQGVLPMLRALLADFAVPARLLTQPGGERALTNLLHLAELLQQAAAELDGEQALIRHLAEQLGGAGQAADEQVVRLESDEDLVKVVTVHKSKGLEYPLVFLPFVCSFREVDGKRLPLRYHDDADRLVLDDQPDAAAVARADRERLAEELRLLYVALTRGRHGCWLGLAPLKYGNGRDCQLHKSALGYLLAGGAAIDAAGLADVLGEVAAGCREINLEPLPEPRPERFRAAPEAALGRAREPARPAREHWWIASYSALEYGAATAPLEGLPEVPVESPDSALAATFSEIADEPATSGPVPAADADLHRFYRGPGPGTFLHGLLEWAAGEGFGRVAAEPALAAQVVARRCQRRGWDDWSGPLTVWLQGLVSQPLRLPEAAPLTLAGLHAYQAELEFWFAASAVDAPALDRLVQAHSLVGHARPALLPTRLNGMLKGFIDLVFEHQGRYYVADYKSNWLGEDAGAYTAEAMRAAVLEKRYDLQYVLYLLALHRQLSARLPGYDYDRHIGGAVYIFLRGSGAPSQGLHCERPPRALIEALDALFAAAPVVEEEPA